jgi:hypothetical protein
MIKNNIQFDRYIIDKFKNKVDQLYEAYIEETKPKRISGMGPLALSAEQQDMIFSQLDADMFQDFLTEEDGANYALFYPVAGEQEEFIAVDMPVDFDYQLYTEKAVATLDFIMGEYDTFLEECNKTPLFDAIQDETFSYKEHINHLKVLLMSFEDFEKVVRDSENTNEFRHLEHLKNIRNSLLFSMYEKDDN